MAFHSNLPSKGSLNYNPQLPSPSELCGIFLPQLLYFQSWKTLLFLGQAIDMVRGACHVTSLTLRGRL